MALDATSARDPRLVGRYRLLQKLGEGGMGVVHLGLDQNGRAVAVKVLRPHIAADPDARRRLAREVATLRRVRHPRVAAVIDADVEGEVPFLVTHFVPGKPLDTHVRDHGPLPRGHIARIGAVLADALRAIHTAGVIHRDVKPANVMLLDGEPILIDFGIAHVADESRITHTGLVMGTPGYLSPEIIGGDPVSAATDWWGWGATLAFAATGRPPFGSGPIEVVLDRVRRGVTDVEGVDAGLRATLTAALAVDPAQRPTPERLIAGLAASAPARPTRVHPERADTVDFSTWEGPTVRRAPTPNGGLPGSQPPPAPVQPAAAGQSAAAGHGAAAATVVGSATKAAPPVHAAPPFHEAPTARHDPVPYEPTRRQPPPNGRPVPTAAADAATSVVPPVPLNGFDASTGTYGPSGAPRPEPWWAPAQPAADQPASLAGPASAPAGPVPAGIAPATPAPSGSAPAGSAPAGRAAAGPAAPPRHSPWHDALRPTPPPPVPDRSRPDRSVPGRSRPDPAGDADQPAGPPPWPSRGVLAGIAVALSAVAAVAPYGAIQIAALGMIVARVVDRSRTALLLRRDQHGARGSDGVVTALALPWRLVKSLLLTIFFLILPALVGISVAFIIASALAGAFARAIPGEPVPLAAGMAALLLTAWWGPGGAAVRRGATRATRVAVPGPRARIAVWALLALVVLSALVVMNNGNGPDWGPWENSRIVQYLSFS